jgi:uncharacterized membrane protein
MEPILVRVGRKFYGICVTLTGIHQLFYSDINPVYIPESSSVWLPGNVFLVFFWSVLLIAGGGILAIAKNPRTTALVLGGIFLVLFLAVQVPHLLFLDPNGMILGAWTHALKELAFSGGAFCVAGSLPPADSTGGAVRFLEKLIPLGRIFFSITMITFGIDHFLYPGFVATLVPAWIPAPVFWTYFAGVALVGAGVAIIAKTQLRLVGILLGTMIFLWFVFLHIPRGMADPFGGNGNEITSVIQSFGFSGIAFVLAYGVRRKEPA